jgi:hypothetical protein
MSYSPLTLARRHVLGELYAACENATKDVPVYLNDTNGEKLGHAAESLGRYADAFTFHLTEENCRKLAGGQFTYSFDYHFSESAAAASKRRRVRLISIILTMRKGYEKPIPKSARNAMSTPKTED